MRIRERFILTNTIVLAGLISTVVLSLWSLNEYRSISATIQQGLRLISDARRVHVLMKDMLIGAFTPETYGELKDIVHLEGINTTRRVWQDAVDDFGGAFEAFMTVPRLQRLVAGDAVLKDEYAVARRLSDRAFEMVISLEERMTVLERRGLLGRDDLYYQIQRSNDPALIGFFSEIRERFVDMEMWRMQWLLRIAHQFGTDNGGGKRGFHTATGRLQCLNPGGQFALKPEQA